MDISDDELTRQALAADADAPLGADAVPLHPGGTSSGLLPEWYMPAPASRPLRPARRCVLAAVVVALVVVSGAGLCVTSGFPEIAW